MNEVLFSLAEITRMGTTGALCTIIRTKGSTPIIDSGVNEDELHRIHAPIGLDISANTPEEIAISIMGEIIQVKRGGTGASLSSGK